jgi:hypothetical protein
MAIKLQIRRDIKTNWDANSGVILLSGEIGYETDTRNMKIGDGTTVWSSLKYQAPYYTAANSGAPNTLLALDVGNSRVGIGNSSPASTLDVTGQVRVRGGSSYSEPSENSSVINYDTTGGILTVDARSGGGTTNIVFRASTSGTGGERVRIRPSGNVLEVNGRVTSNRTTAGTFDVSGDGVYTFGTDTKQYIYGKPGNDGSVAIYTTTAGGTTNDRLNVTSTVVQVKTPLTTTSTATIGDALTVTTGGLTVTAGGATVTAGGLTVTAGSVSLPSNSVSLGTVAQIAAGNFLGNSSGSTANVAAVTQDQARTMLGLGTNAYLAGVVINSSSTWVDLAVAGTGTINKNFSVSSLTIGQPTLVALQFSRSANSAILAANLVLASTDIVTIISASDNGTTGTIWGTTASSNQCAWYRRGVATAGEKDYPGPITLIGTQTFKVFGWQQVSGTAPDGPRAYVYMVRQQ